MVSDFVSRLYPQVARTDRPFMLIVADLLPLWVGASGRVTNAIAFLWNAMLFAPATLTMVIAALDGLVLRAGHISSFAIDELVAAASEVTTYCWVSPATVNTSPFFRVAVAAEADATEQYALPAVPDAFPELRVPLVCVLMF